MEFALTEAVAPASTRSMPRRDRRPGPGTSRGRSRRAEGDAKVSEAVQAVERLLRA